MQNFEELANSLGAQSAERTRLAKQVSDLDTAIKEAYMQLRQHLREYLVEFIKNNRVNVVQLETSTGFVSGCELFSPTESTRFICSDPSRIYVVKAEFNPRRNPAISHSAEILDMPRDPLSNRDTLKTIALAASILQVHANSRQPAT